MMTGLSMLTCIKCWPEIRFPYNVRIKPGLISTASARNWHGQSESGLSPMACSSQDGLGTSTPHDGRGTEQASACNGGIRWARVSRSTSTLCRCHGQFGGRVHHFLENLRPILGNGHAGLYTQSLQNSLRRHLYKRGRWKPSRYRHRQSQGKEHQGEYH